MILKLGGWIMFGGALSFIAAVIIGAGPCTATTSGVRLLLAGIVALGIGLLIVTISSIGIAVQMYQDRKR
jgi:pheromone shutdown protein TraB